ncbi:MAG: hypothetical protein ACE15C_00840 [Phycisphaerae bacterium]
MKARFLMLALPAALVLACAYPVIAQDKAADDARALLKQGLDQFKALEFKDAKATLLKVDSASLGDADKKALEDHLAKVDQAITDQAAAREAYTKAEEALKAGDLAKAKEGFAKASESPYVTAKEQEDAKAQLAVVNKKIEATTSAAPAVEAAPTPKVAPAAASTPLATMEANRAAKAKELLDQGKAALDNEQADVAVDLLKRSVALDPANAEAKQLLAIAQDKVAKQAAAVEVTGPLSQLEKERKVLVEATLLDFDRSMKRSRESASAADSAAAFDTAVEAARAARKAIEDNKTLFPDKVYRDKIAEADDQIKFVLDRKDAWERKQAQKQALEIELAAKKRIEDMEQAKRKKISDLRAKAKVLSDQGKYKESLDLLDQILKLDPNDAYARGAHDYMLTSDLLRTEGDLYKQYTVEMRKTAIDIRESEIPWYDYVKYPKDWRQLTEKREPFSATAASESEADHAAALKLKKRIPKLDFNNLEFGNVIQFFKDVSGVDIVPNYNALQVANVTKDTPITLSLQNVTVETALKQVLQDLSTTTAIRQVIQDGIVQISTKDDLAKSPILRVYDIRDLIIKVPNFAGPILQMQTMNIGNCSCSYNNGPFGCCTSCGCTCNGVENEVTRTELIANIIKTITDNIDRDSWRPTGTVGSISELGGQLIVTQTAENHQQLVSLIDQLREMRTLQISIEARFISVSNGFFNSIGVDVDLFFNLGSGLGGGNPGGVVLPGGGQGFVTDPATGARVPTHGTSAWGAGKPGTENVTPIGVITQGGQKAIGFGNMLGVSTPAPNSIGGQVTTPALSIAGTFLDDVQVDFLVQATQANAMTRLLTAPRLTLFNGQRAFVTVGTQQAYVSQFTPVVSENAVSIQPTVSSVMTGSVLDVEATVTADRRYVTMTVRPSVTTLNSLTNFNTGAGVLQLPNVTVEQIQTTVNVPDGGTLLLGGQKLAAEVEREGGVPMLSQIPILNRLFTNRGKVRDEQTLLILIKPKIIIPRELEEENFPPIR